MCCGVRADSALKNLELGVEGEGEFPILFELLIDVL